MTFEHTHHVTEAEYVTLFGLSQPGTTAQRVRGSVVLALGLLFLLWQHTVGLGVVMLVLAGLASLMPYLFPGTAARTFRQMQYLAGPVTYGASDDRLWIRGSDFVAEIPWRCLTVWRERDDWLILSASAFPPVLLPIAALKSTDSYDRVTELANRYAVKFGSAEAQLRF